MKEVALIAERVSGLLLLSMLLLLPGSLAAQVHNGSSKNARNSSGLKATAKSDEPIRVPQIDGDFWQVAGDPDLGKYTTAKQQPVDFGVWQAADGTWQIHWSASRKVAFGGSQGNGLFSAECPFVYCHKASGYYYLLRNQLYGENARFAVYRSKNPRDFGKDNNQYLVESMPYAAPEIIESNGQLCIAVLLPNLKGIRIAQLTFAPTAKE